MSSCCQSSTNNRHLKRQTCPADGNNYSQIELKSILHQIKEPWNFHEKPKQAYYYCSNPNCEVVYFSSDKSTITTSQLKNPESKSKTLCFCYGIDFDDLKSADQAKCIKQFILKQTKNGDCACDVKNISGKCCLRNFPFN